MVEDCKSVGKYVLLSDIEVHREQIQNNVCFFDPRSSEDLAQKLELLFRSPPNKQFAENSELSLSKMGNDFLAIVLK